MQVSVAVHAIKVSHSGKWVAAFLICDPMINTCTAFRYWRSRDRPKEQPPHTPRCPFECESQRNYMCALCITAITHTRAHKLKFNYHHPMTAVVGYTTLPILVCSGGGLSCIQLHLHTLCADCLVFPLAKHTRCDHLIAAQVHQFTPN